MSITVSVETGSPLYKPYVRVVYEETDGYRTDSTSIVLVKRTTTSRRSGSWMVREHKDGYQKISITTRGDMEN